MRGAARFLPLLALAALAGACVDFVDPDELGLARDTRAEVVFDLATDPLRAGCSGGGAAGGGSAVLCFRATVDPGYTRLGERLRVPDDTLRAMGVALSPTVGGDGVLRYERGFVLPVAGLEAVPFTAVLPRVEGSEPRAIRWFAAAPAGPDTLLREPGAGVGIDVRRPAGVSLPAPGDRFWSVDVTGDTARATYNASGEPRAAYAFPAEVLAALGGTRFRAELRWIRSLSSSAGGLRLVVRFNEWLDWTVLTREEGEGG